MKTHARRVLFAAALAAVASLASPASAESPSNARFYKYASNDAEYSVLLPDAPSVTTVWADDKDVPYLKERPEDGGVIGEIAYFRRQDDITDDTFSAKITFLKASKDFLASLTEDSIRQTLENDLKDVKLDNKQFNYSAGSNTLKWATLTGFSVDKSNRPFYFAEHYLTGERSILVILVQYSVENRTFEDFYKEMTNNITYHPQ